VDLTVEAWVNFSSLDSWSFVVTKAYGPVSDDSFALWFSDGSMRGGVNAGASLGGAFDQPGTWHFVALTYDHRTQTENLYVDGLLVNGATAPEPPWIVYDANALLIGADFGNEQVTPSMYGMMDEVRVWSVARTSEQILADQHRCERAPMDGLVAYWSFDEGTGQTVGDISGNGNSGLLGSTSGHDTADPQWVDSTVPF
jgi:hypothetical protein